jgi:HEAT repeat protein
VRKAAADSLGFLGENSAVEGLCELVFDPDRDVREAVIVALSKIGDPRAVGPLVQAMLDAETPVRNAANAALLAVNRHWAESEAAKAMLPKIQSALKHPDYWIRHSATKLLERMRIDINSLNIEESTVSPGAERPPHPAAAMLADMLFDRDGAFRLAAAVALGKVREHGAKSILAAAGRDSDVSVRTAAQAALTAIH